MVKSVQHFHHYLYGRQFTVCTDHAALKWLLNFRNPEGQIAQWIERLQHYDSQIEHIPGDKQKKKKKKKEFVLPVCISMQSKGLQLDKALWTARQSKLMVASL